MNVILDLCIVPIGVGVSLSPYELPGVLLPYLCRGWTAAEPRESNGKLEEPAFFSGTS